MAIPTTATALPNLLVLEDHAHALYVFIWTDTDSSLVYEVVGRKEDFDAANKQTVNINKIKPDGSLDTTTVKFYGVPTSARVVKDKIEVRVANFAAMQPTAADRIAGDTLLGTYLDKITLTTNVGQWLTWMVVSANTATHRPKQPVLEVCRSATENPVFPGGVICAEYQRNAAGEVLLDTNGSPKLSLIDSGGAASPENSRVGRLVLGFEQDFFGPGKHAWVGSGGTASAVCAFDLFVTGSGAAGNIALQPGTVNQFLPTNMFANFAYNFADTVYAKVVVATDGRQVTSASIAVDATPAIPIPTTMSLGPASFEVLVGVVALGKAFKTWGQVFANPQSCVGNIAATLYVSHFEDVATPVPGLSPYIRYYSWAVNVM